jgi:protein-disulfide isomerase
MFRKPAPPVTLVESTLPTPAPTPVAVAAVAPATPAPKPAAPNPAPAAKPAPAPPQTPAGPPIYKWTGQPGAPIVCEIYSDFECPICARIFLEVMPQFDAQFVHTGKVRLLHRDFPLRQHQHSMLAARYANAAGRAGVYDLVARQLFLTQEQWSKDGNIEAQLAAVVSPGVLKQIHDMVESHSDIDDSIQSDMTMGAHDNVNGTPTLVVVFGGKRQVLPRFPSLEMLKRYFDDLLK